MVCREILQRPGETALETPPPGFAPASRYEVTGPPAGGPALTATSRPSRLRHARTPQGHQGGVGANKKHRPEAPTLALTGEPVEEWVTSPYGDCHMVLNY